MAGKLSKILNLINNMGWRYAGFRARYELLRRAGMLKRGFPAAPDFRRYMSLQQWKQQSGRFFFSDRESLRLKRAPSLSIEETYRNIRSGRILMFGSVLTDLGAAYDWVTNPDSGYKYDIAKHWTEIADYSKEAGDIKFVWEKSRFAYLYDVIRYDHHFGKDCSEFVFSEILSWIKSNPVNCGPNYRCSQEMSLRVLNWTFALYYYRNSPLLTDEVFDQVQYAIYWHLHHVYKNIDFSRTAVRNNHAITETLALYLAGIFYPGMPGAAQWRQDGKKWFEEEIAYQVYEDGTYLQFSMNYHRVVVQLMTWAIVLSERNGDRFSETVYDRARSSVKFLRTCMVEENGWLPNYGANDGALFFRLCDAHFRDHRPQLHALAAAVGCDIGVDACEDATWYGIERRPHERHMVPGNGAYSFAKGGYYVVRDTDTLTFIKCGSYKDRPSHADNLHVDIWYKGENVFIDAGSYKYNTDNETIRYFSGTRSHNTVMLGDKDQMIKGGRFIWYYWSQAQSARVEEHEQEYVFEGAVSAFRYINAGIVHRRRIVKAKGIAAWEVEDRVQNAPRELMINQLWHYLPGREQRFSVVAVDAQRKPLTATVREGWYSSLYAGRQEACEQVFTVNAADSIETQITIR